MIRYYAGINQRARRCMVFTNNLLIDNIVTEKKLKLKS